MSSTPCRGAVIALSILFIANPLQASTPLGSGITYQGQLKQDGQPASGNFVMSFALFDEATEGDQVGPTLVFDGLKGNPGPITVADGLFSVLLDFGGTAYTGEARWLEISVEGTPLSPRQALTAAPYALKVPGVDGHSLDAPDGNPVDAISVDDNGNLAVGTVTPYAHVTIQGGLGLDANSTNDGDLFTGMRFGDASSGEGLSSKRTGGGNQYGLDFYTSFSRRLSIKNSGQVGIGTDAPFRPLTVVGGISLDATNQNDGTIEHGLLFGGDGSGEGIASRRTAGVNQFGLDFYTSGASKMSITSDGMVGIGTDDPQATIHAKSTGFNLAAFESDSTFGTRLLLDNTSEGGHQWSLLSKGAGNPTGGGDFIIEDLTTFAMRFMISEQGLVGIGTSSPSALLHVAGDARIAGPATIDDAATINGAATLNSETTMNANAKIAGANTLELGAGVPKEANAGKIGYGTFTPGALDITGGGTLAINRNIIFWAEGGSIFKGAVGILTSSPDQTLSIGSGDASKPGGGSWATFSDKRLKRDIQPIEGALDKLMELHGVTFEYTDPKSINELPGQRVGMVAQDVEQVFPDWVNEGKSGYKSVTYRGFEALTVEALRDLRAEKDRQLAQKDAELGRLRAEHQSQLLELRREKDAEVGELSKRLERLEALMLQK